MARRQVNTTLATLAVTLVSLGAFACMGGGGGRKGGRDHEASVTGGDVLPDASAHKGSSGPTKSYPATDTPSFVLINIDDLDLRLMEATPDIKAISAGQGVEFPNFYVSLPLCCPSRTTLLRGQYPHNTGVVDNNGPGGGWAGVKPLESDTLATWLDDKGYTTGLVGKYMNGYPGRDDLPAPIPAGWDRWVTPVPPGSPYGQYDYSLQIDSKIEAHGREESDYMTDVLGRHAMDFLDDRKKDDAPFFLYITPTTPHLPSPPAPRHKGTLRVQAPRVLSFNEPDASDKPWLPPEMTGKKLDRLDSVYQDRAEAMLSVRDLVQDVIDRLDKDDLLDTTYVIVISDNGFKLGEHRFPQGKNTPFQEDVHLPMYWRGPGITAGGSIPDLTMMSDIGPTIAELAGAKTPDWVDGRSFAAALLGKPGGTARKGLLIEAPAGHDASNPTVAEDEDAEGGEGEGGKGQSAYAGVVTDRWKFVKWHDGSKTMLFDLQKDPYELDSLHASPDQKTRVAAMSAWVDALSACEGAACRKLEDTLPDGI